MKTSLDLPDDLYRQLKARAALEGRTVREVATALFRAWVDGRVRTDELDAASSSKDPALEHDPRRAWLARWHSLSAHVADAAEREDAALPVATKEVPRVVEDTSLVARLQADRR